ncbi:MAG: hypothetical protein ACREKE_04065 [bacterium]
MGTNSARELYLELLKRILTNALSEEVPDADQEEQHRFVEGFIRHYMKGPAISMLPLTRMDNLRTCVEDVLRQIIRKIAFPARFGPKWGPYPNPRFPCPT